MKNEELCGYDEHRSVVSTSNKYLLLIVPVRGTHQKSQESADAIRYITIHSIIIFTIY